MDINRVVLVGRVTSDPQIFKTKSEGKLANFTIAVNRASTKEKETVADFIPCVAVGSTVEYLEKFVKKGYLIGVDGRLQLNKYQAKDGTNKQTLKVYAFQVQNYQTKPTSQSNDSQGYSQNVDMSSYNQSVGGFDDSNNPYSNNGIDYAGDLGINADDLPFSGLM